MVWDHIPRRLDGEIELLWFTITASAFSTPAQPSLENFGLRDIPQVEEETLSFPEQEKTLCHKYKPPLTSRRDSPSEVRYRPSSGVYSHKAPDSESSLPTRSHENCKLAELKRRITLFSFSADRCYGIALSPIYVKPFSTKCLAKSSPV